jgi:hypothetical protein
LALHIIKLLRTRPSAVFQIDQLVGAHGLPADAVRMGLFLGGFTGIYNGMRCLLARWSGRDDVSTVMVSGAVAGLALNFHPKDSHRTLALYVLARVFQCWYNKAKVAGKWHLWGSDWSGKQQKQKHRQPANDGGQPRLTTPALIDFDSVDFAGCRCLTGHTAIRCCFLSAPHK